MLIWLSDFSTMTTVYVLMIKGKKKITNPSINTSFSRMGSWRGKEDKPGTSLAGAERLRAAPDSARTGSGPQARRTAGVVP